MWACPLALRWIASKFDNEASVVISQPLDPLKEKELLVQKLVCHLQLCESHYPQKTSIRKGKLAMLLSLIFVFYYFSFFFLPLLCRHKCLEFSDGSTEFKWLFKGKKFKWMEQRYFLYLHSQNTGLENRNNSIFNLADYLHHGER